jgi:hypothetical protein
MQVQLDLRNLGGGCHGGPLLASHFPSRPMGASARGPVPGQGLSKRIRVPPRCQPRKLCPGPSAGTPRCAAMLAATSANHQPGFARAAPMDQHGHALAGVVGAAPGRIVAMIGGEKCHVAGAERVEEPGQRRVERSSAAGVAGDVAAMAVKAVELDEIGEDQRCRRARWRSSPRRSRSARRRRRPCAPRRRRDGRRCRRSCRPITAPPAACHPVAERGLGRRDRVVAAVVGAGEAGLACRGRAGRSPGRY